MPITETTVAFIGANSGLASAIAKGMAGDNYRLLLYGDAPELLQREIKQQYADADVHLLHSLYHSCWEADIIIIADAFHPGKKTIDTIREVTTQKVFVCIDTYPANDTTCTLVRNRAEQIQELLPHSQVIAATELMSIAGGNHQDPCKKQTNIIIAGRDEKAQKLVSQLITAAGFNPQLLVYDNETKS